jgi:diguanylate cyclase (GGDEF)-like protein
MRIDDPALTTPRRRVYAGFGFLLALGGPIGLVLLRSLQHHRAPIDVLTQEVPLDWPLYAYVAFSTAAAFTGFGAAIGRLQDELRELSLTDALTGLANRRHLEIVLAHELPRARRDRSELSVLLVDVDELKHINDAGGHASGDRALRAVAAGLRSACRKADLPARLGGDEFAILAATRLDDAVRLAERVRASIAAQPDAPRVSVGVASLAALESPSADTLLAAADAALYVAKTGGRDRVAVAGSSRV